MIATSVGRSTLPPTCDGCLTTLFRCILLQGLNYLLPLAVLPYLVRVLGMETYGLVAVAQSFAQYFNILTDYGFNFSATRSIAQSKDEPGQISRIFCCVFLIKICLTAVGLVVLGCVLLTVSRMRHDWTIFIYAFAGVVGNVLFPVWYFQGLERMRHISIISGATKALSAVLLFVFVHHSSGRGVGRGDSVSRHVTRRRHRICGLHALRGSCFGVAMLAGPENLFSGGVAPLCLHRLGQPLHATPTYFLLACWPAMFKPVISAPPIDWSVPPTVWLVLSPKRCSPT